MAHQELRRLQTFPTEYILELSFGLMVRFEESRLLVNRILVVAHRELRHVQTFLPEVFPEAIDLPKSPHPGSSQLRLLIHSMCQICVLVVILPIECHPIPMQCCFPEAPAANLAV